jgi:hypothetical protein
MNYKIELALVNALAIESTELAVETIVNIVKANKLNPYKVWHRLHIDAHFTEFEGVVYDNFIELKNFEALTRIFRLSKGKGRIRKVLK